MQHGLTTLPLSMVGQQHNPCLTELKRLTVTTQYYMSRECDALTAKRPYLLCSNHQCHVDAPLWSYTLLQALNLLQLSVYAHPTA